MSDTGCNQRITPNSAAIVFDKNIFELHTLPFLRRLSGTQDAENIKHFPFTFQTYDDSGKDQSLSKTFHESFEKCIDALIMLNKRGAAICVSVNAASGKSRSKDNIVLLRAWWADIDTIKATAPFDVDSLPLPPSMVIKTPGGSHLYWMLVKPEKCDNKRRLEHENDLKRIQAHLEDCGADKAVCDVSRVLRLPGFYHCKGRPKLVTIENIESAGRGYTPIEIRSAFPDTEIPAKRIQVQSKPELGQAVASGVEASENAYDEKRVKAYLDKCPAAIQGQEGSKTLLETALKVIQAFNLNRPDTVDALLKYYNSRCKPPWSLGELRHKVEDALEIINGKDGGIMQVHENTQESQPAKNGEECELMPFDTEMPWVKVHVNFWQDDKIIQLDPAQFGLLVRLNLLCAMRNVIPTDIKTLARQTGFERKDINKHFPAVEQFFFKTKNGDYMYSPVMKEKVDTYRAYAEKHKENSRKGGIVTQKNRKRNQLPLEPPLS